MHCTVVSRKPFKLSQTQQFTKKTQISFLSLQMPAKSFFEVFFFSQIESAPGSTGTAHSFCSKMKPFHIQLCFRQQYISWLLCGYCLLTQCRGSTHSPNSCVVNQAPSANCKPACNSSALEHDHRKGTVSKIASDALMPFSSARRASGHRGNVGAWRGSQGLLSAGASALNIRQGSILSGFILGGGGGGLCVCVCVLFLSYLLKGTQRTWSHSSFLGQL